MSRKPVSKSTFREVRSAGQTVGYFDLIEPPTNGSKRTDHLDEPSRPSTGRPKKSTPRNFAKAVEASKEYGQKIVEGLWEANSASHLVGLYTVLHEHIYGTPPLEMLHDYAAACSSADKLVRDEFAGDYLEAQRFVAWCWARTARRKKREPDSDFRLGWRLQFKSRNFLTDYRAAAHQLKA